MRYLLYATRHAAAAVLFSLALTAPSAALDFDRGSAPSFAKIMDGVKAGAQEVKAPTVSTAPVSSELEKFWEKLKFDTVDSICRSAEIKLNEEARLDAGPGIGAEFKRFLRKDAAGKLYLLDEIGLNLSFALGHELAQIPNVGPFSVNFSGVMAGKSVVVQPLEHDRYCQELGTLAKLYKVKVVVPATAKRISEMKPREIWKLPLTLRMAFGAGVTAPVNPYVTVTVSASAAKEKRPSVTLNRLDESRLRLRLRLDRVEVTAVGAAVTTVQLPMEQIGLIDAENLIANEINRAWAREVNNYIAAKLSFGRSRAFGKRLLLEFILDPRDPAQMAALEKFLQGDLGVVKRLLELGVRFNDITEEDDSATGLQGINAAADQAGAGLGQTPSFAGSDAHHSETDHFNIQIPVIHAHNSSNSSSYNRYQSLENGGETLHVRQESRVSNGASLDVPFMGKMIKHDTQQNVYVVNREGRDGAVTRPVMVYQHYEGFVRQSDGDARDMVGRANNVLRYVGMKGSGVDNSNTLPLGAIFPQLPPRTDGDGFEYNPSKTYHSALMGFKLLINERGLQDIIFAPARSIMYAFLNMMCEEHWGIITKAWRLFRIDENGKVGYDEKEMRKALGAGYWSDYESPQDDPMNTVYFLAKDATRVIADIFSVKNAGGWREQSDRLAKIASGDSRSGLKYDKFMKLVVQLVDPLDVSAELYLHTDKRVKGEADVTHTYNFFNGAGNDLNGTLGAVTGMRERFADPSQLSD